MFPPVEYLVNDILLDECLTCAEKILLIALAADRGIDGGSTSSNATLIRLCGFKANGPDKGQRTIKQLLKDLQEKDHIRIGWPGPSVDNPTGRAIYLVLHLSYMIGSIKIGPEHSIKVFDQDA